MESVNIDIGRAVHHVWCYCEPATSVRGGAGGTSRRIVRNDSKVEFSPDVEVEGELAIHGDFVA